MAQYTEHYNLTLPEGSEPARIGDINANMETLDNALYLTAQKADIATLDYIIEESLNYRKWNSGKLECWGTWTNTVGEMSAVGSLYETDVLYNELPVTPTNIISLTCMAQANGYIYRYNDDVDPCAFVFCSPTSLDATTDILIDYYFIGTWNTEE